MPSESAVIDYAERAEFYELEYTDSADIPFLLSQIDDTVATVMEAPCGVGRVTLPMAALGRTITAVDIEPAMIEMLTRRSRDAKNGERIVGVVADIRCARLGETFDLVMSPAEGIQLFLDDTDLSRTVMTLAKHVARGGRMMLDCATFDRAAVDNEDEIPGYFDPRLEDGREILEWEKPLSDGGTLSRWRTQWNRGPTVRFAFRYRRSSPNRPDHTFSSELELRRPNPDLVVAAAEAAGLVLDSIDGDRNGAPTRPGMARMIFYFHRPKPQG